MMTSWSLSVVLPALLELKYLAKILYNMFGGDRDIRTSKVHTLLSNIWRCKCHCLGILHCKFQLEPVNSVILKFRVEEKRTTSIPEFHIDLHQAIYECFIFVEFYFHSNSFKLCYIQIAYILLRLNHVLKSGYFFFIMNFQNIGIYHSLQFEMKL